MKNLNFIFVAILCFCFNNASNACEVTILNNSKEEIKNYEEAGKFRTSEGRLYIDSDLLTINSNGMFILLGDQQILIPELHYDSEGFSLGYEACVSLGAIWGCCSCFGSNPYWKNVCEGCGHRRCGK